MTTTIYFTATTIDGFIADERNSLDWLFPWGEADVHERHWNEFFGQVGAMAMGATTYRWVLDHEDLIQNPGRWREFYGDVPCWVFAHRDLPPIPGADLRFVQGDVVPVHRDMVAAAGDRNVWLVGGGELVGQFADQGLLDRLDLHVAPVTLGAGAPLLPRRLTTGLRLATVDRDKDFAYLTYEVSHEPDADPAPPEPPR
jgi:dihydrofolate reductase